MVETWAHHGNLPHESRAQRRRAHLLPNKSRGGVAAQITHFTHSGTRSRRSASLPACRGAALATGSTALVRAVLCYTASGLIMLDALLSTVARACSCGSPPALIGVPVLDAGTLPANGLARVWFRPYDGDDSTKQARLVMEHRSMFVLLVALTGCGTNAQDGACDLYEPLGTAVNAATECPPYPSSCPYVCNEGACDGTPGALTCENCLDLANWTDAACDGARFRFDGGAFEHRCD